MILTLEVTGEQTAQLGAARRKVFVGIGGTIGRLADNDWVLPDPYISGRHALIRYLNGRFFIEDTSTNGVFLNSPDTRLTRAEAHPLKHGDVLYIDTYEIAVSIERDAAADSEKANDPLAMLREHADRKRAGGESRAAESAQRSASAVPAPPAEAQSQNINSADAEDRANSSNETQWFGLSDMSQAELNALAQSRQAPHANGHEPPAARAAEASSEDGGREAALQTALRAAFESMLAQFDPDRLQEEFDRHIRIGSMLGVPAKLRYWDLYRERYGNITRDTEASFRTLLGDEFAKAFARHLTQRQTHKQD